VVTINKKIVLTGGVFDIIHLGHIYTLTEAKKYGDILVVVIANDKFISKKGRTPIHQQKYRAKLVEMLKPVDKVVLGGDDPKKLVDEIKPDVIVYGYDQPIFLKPKGVKIVKLENGFDSENLKTGKIIEKFGL